MLFNQSEESKQIKRLNEQLKQVSKLTDKDESNPILTPWSRAIRESGLEYSKEGNRYKIRNTKANREKLGQISEKLKEYRAQTVSDFNKEVKKELKAEAEKKSKEEIKPDEKSTPKQIEKKRKKYIRQYTSPKRIKARREQVLQTIEISEKLQVIYKQSPTLGNWFARRLRKITKGKAKSTWDMPALYDEFGRISEQARRLQRGDLTEAEEERKQALSDITDDFANFGTEVTTSGKLGKNRKRKNKR